MVAVKHLVLAALDEFFTVKAEEWRKFCGSDVVFPGLVDAVALRAATQAHGPVDIFSVAFHAHACTPISSVWISTLRKK